MQLPDKVLRMVKPADRARMGKAGQTVEEAQAVLMARNERELQDQIMGMLNREGIVGFRARTDKKSTIAVGHPDIWFSLGGRACAFEVKMPGKKPRPEQETMMAAMRKNGWRVVVVTSYVEARQALDNFAGIL